MHKHLIFESDHSMIMTVLLLSVWLHYIQVTICCFVKEAEQTSMIILYLKNYF